MVIVFNGSCILSKQVSAFFISGLLKKSECSVYTDEGFCYWNDGKRKFEKHQSSVAHKHAVELLHGKSQPRIDEALDSAVLKTKKQNYQMLVHVIRALKFLTRQNLALRGKSVTNEEFTEPNSNLIQVMRILNPYLINPIMRIPTKRLLTKFVSVVK